MSTLEQGQSPLAARHYEFSLGDELRGERATKGKTLLDVQRDLRIQASYIAAIEDGNPEAFPNPSFIPGYIRSYSRYLCLDPDEIYARFCAENGITPTREAAAAGKGAERERMSFEPKYPLVEQRGGFLPSIDLSAVGSVLVVCALAGALGYGGWTVLQNIQRVQFAPVDDVPIAVAEITPIKAPTSPYDAATGLAELAAPVSSEALTELYRQQEQEVPILAPRDGPIASIDPDQLAPLSIQQIDRLTVATAEPPAALRAGTQDQAPRADTGFLAAPEIRTSEISGEIIAPVPQETTHADSAIAIVAERAAWVRVYQENGTVIFEKILEKGESYTPPAGIDAPQIWAGNSGSVYVRLGNELRGPLGFGTRAVRDVSLDPVALAANFEIVTDVPETVSQTVGLGTETETPVAIR